MTHDVTPGAIAGIDDELLSSARLDDLLSCWAGHRRDGIRGGRHRSAIRVMPVMALFDHEEVGSSSSSGAAGDLLATTLERIVRAPAATATTSPRALAGSRLVSTDGAHATHPNYAERHDPAHLGRRSTAARC